MKRKLCLLGIILHLSIFNGYSLDGGKDFIVLPSLDTIYGKIETNTDLNFRSSLWFHGQDGSMTEYSVDEIISFYIEGDNRYFESKSILINEIPNRVFLRCLVKGDISLYLLREKSEKYDRYFYQRGEYFTELISTSEQKTIDGKLYNIYNSEYILTLKNELVNICQGMLGSVDAVKFEERALTLFIDQINKCISDENTSNVYMIKKKVILKSGVSASMGIDKGWPAKGTSYGVGFYQEARLPEILPQGMFFSYGLGLEYGFSERNTSDTRQAYQKISVPVLMNFEIRTQKVQPYLMAGINMLHYFTLGKQIDEGTPPDVTGGLVWPLSIGGGVKTKKLNFQLITNSYDTRLKFVYFLNDK